MRLRILALTLLLGSSGRIIAQTDGETAPSLEQHWGNLTLHPGGFFDSIVQFRTKSTGDTISTRFSRIPLTQSPDEWLGSVAHSRFSLKSSLPAGNWKFITYYEMDFQGSVDPYRVRQLYGQARNGEWSILAGRAWSLLRPNVTGMESDTQVFISEVIEPLYHVGMAGSRREQLRITRSNSSWGVAVSLERRTEMTGADALIKIMAQPRWLDRPWHFEIVALGAPANRAALGISAIIPITSRLNFVTENLANRHTGAESLGILPVGANGISFLQGGEYKITNTLELYSYGGLVYGEHSAGNRLGREWTVGARRVTPVPHGYGSVRTGMQFSQLDREPWSKGRGELTQLQLQVRYDLW